MKELKPGDRIRAYYCLGGKPKGTVITVGSELITFKADEDGTQRQAHIKAVRRLIRKAPKPVGDKKRVYGVNAPRLELFAWEITPGQWLVDENRPSLGRDRVYYRVVGCSEGEIVLSREKLAKAFWEGKKAASEGLRPGMAPFPDEVLNEMCKALGLGDQK